MLQKRTRKGTKRKPKTWQRDRDSVLLAENLHYVREQRGLSLSEASKFTGVAISTLSKIENGKMSPTFDIVNRIMRGLQISPAFLFGPWGESSPPRPSAVDRRKNPIVISIPGSEHEILCADNVPRDLFPTIVTLHSHEHHDLTAHGCEEFIMVLDGSLEIAIKGEGVICLEKDECFYFDKTTPHSFRALGDTPVRYLAVSNRTSLDLSPPVGRQTPITAKRLRELIIG